MAGEVAAHQAVLVRAVPVRAVRVALAPVVRPALAAELRVAGAARPPRTAMPQRRMHHLRHRPQLVEAREAALVEVVAHGAGRFQRPRGRALRLRTEAWPIGLATGRSRRAF